MRSRAGRWLVLVLLLAGGAGAALSSWRAHTQLTDLDVTQGELNDRLDRLSGVLDSILAAQQAYITPAGERQPPGATALIETFLSEATALRPHVRSIGGGREVQAITNSIDALGDVESRAEEHVRLGQDLMAADLVFTEGRAAAESVASGLRRLRSSESAAYSTARASTLQVAWIVLGSVAVLWLLGLAVLVRIPAAPAQPHAPVTASGATLFVDAALRHEPASAPRPDLQAAATVCTAMGQLTNAVELPGLLQRAAAVLDASGVVVWMAAGEELFAAAAFGYPPQVMRQLGPINRSAANATAAAWRAGVLQAVSGDSAGRSALAAPLMGAERCIGVLAIEVPIGLETDETGRAIATMFAAQLTAALAGWPAASTAAPVQAPPLDRAAEA
jgi:hypothetical protein